MGGYPQSLQKYSMFVLKLFKTHGILRKPSKGQRPSVPMCRLVRKFLSAILHEGGMYCWVGRTWAAYRGPFYILFHNTTPYTERYGGFLQGCWNRGPESSTRKGCSIINHPFGATHLWKPPYEFNCSPVSNVFSFTSSGLERFLRGTLWKFNISMEKTPFLMAKSTINCHFQ